ncbi:beta-lactamase class A [Micromonospora vinacea]|uniref:Beta-lactamase class A n=1 Tax=Micromonospora vinacea TaxID=709878 RepID=A0ABS0KAM0_9ACTN|nr:serine hydrolase [Micromonospora vinacea]MBG6105694.1 beta-lactamase class A [Micromonospora vinacea]
MAEREGRRLPRRWVVSAVTLSLAGVATGAFGATRARDGDRAGPSHGPSPTSPIPTTPAIDRIDQARTRIKAYVQRYDGHLAVAALDRQGTAAVTVGARRFETASIVKVNILAALLLRQNPPGKALSADTRRLAEAMIVSSDNDAAVALWERIEGSRGLAAANRELGLRETRPNVHWGITTTTAADQLRLLTALTSPTGPLTPQDRTFIMGLMKKVTPEQRWGVSAARESGSRSYYVKNGWDTADVDGGRWLVNSIGRIVEARHDWLIAVLSDHHVSQKEGIRVVERAATYVLKELRAATADDHPPQG